MTALGKLVCLLLEDRLPQVYYLLELTPVEHWQCRSQRQDTQHNDIQHNDTQPNDIQHNNKQNATLSIKSETALLC
jgi:hypothetical protein